MAESNEFIPWHEQTEADWRGYLAEFEEKVLPVFQQYKYNRQIALLAWMLCSVKDAVGELRDMLSEE